MTRFILIRHGETSWTEQKRYQGWSDIELSPRGRKNIGELSSMLRIQNLDQLFTSPLKRARQSSEIISSRINLHLVTDARLKEINFGEWIGDGGESVGGEVDVDDEEKRDEEGGEEEVEN